MESKVEILENVCKKILDMDPRFRFAGVVTDKGKLVAGGPKRDVKPLVDKRESEMLLVEIALFVRLRREYDAHLGPVNFMISHSDKTALLSFPVGDSVLCVSATNDIDLGKTPFEILQILRSEYQ